MLSRPAPLILAVILSVKMVMIAALLGKDITEQFALAARYTARIGLPIFLIAYSASSLVRLWPTNVTRAIMRNRRQWGLSFAVSHTVHLVALTGYQILTDQMPSPLTLVGGGGAYVMMYTMAFTSNNASMRVMGKWWKRLHTLGIHWLWVVFAFSYFGRLFRPDQQLQGAVLFALCLAALGLRIAAAAKTRVRVPA